MGQAIIIHQHGGPEVLRLEPLALGEPAPGELRLRQTAVGVNYHDVYVRSGLYRTLTLPGTPGLEGVGVVEAVGSGVTGFGPGDRIGYVDGRYGAYATHKLVAADQAVRLPDGVDDALAASLLIKGLTAQILTQRVHPITAGERVLVHAAAGGVGALLVQLAAGMGAEVIGTAGSPEKAEIARGLGCRAVILYRQEDFAERVRALTGGAGADVVFDAVGRDTFDGSLASLALRGHLVNYGQASGPIPPFDISRLAPKSATLTRPGYSHYLETPERLRTAAAALFQSVLDGALRPERPRSWPLAQAGEAHAALERRERGPFILVP
ncbi:MAG: quinone oxidoreductase [Phenylobacterium sp.]